MPHKETTQNLTVRECIKELFHQFIFTIPKMSVKKKKLKYTDQNVV